jgi:hypothetical protein
LIARIIFGDEYKSLRSSLSSLLHSPVTTSLLGPNILLSTLFTSTLCLCSSLSVRDHVSHPYKTTGKTIISFYAAVTIYDGGSPQLCYNLPYHHNTFDKMQSSHNKCLAVVLTCFPIAYVSFHLQSHRRSTDY